MAKRLKATLTCPVCKDPFHPFRADQIYCSRMCFKTAMGIRNAEKVKKPATVRKNRKRPPLQEVNCKGCGAVFLARNAKYHSFGCYTAFRIKSSKKAPNPGICHCGKPMPKQNKTHCSRACYLASLNRITPTETDREREAKRKAWQIQLMVPSGICALCGSNQNVLRSEMLAHTDESVCLDCYVFSISRRGRSGLCLNCGDPISPGSLFCRRCSKTTKRGEFTSTAELARIAALTHPEIAAERKRRWTIFIQESKVKQDAAREAKRQLTACRNWEKLEEKQRRQLNAKKTARYQKGIERYEKEMSDL